MKRFAILSSLLLAVAIPQSGRAGSFNLQLQFANIYGPDGVSLISTGSAGILVADTLNNGWGDVDVPPQPNFSQDLYNITLNAGQIFGGDNLIVAVFNAQQMAEGAGTMGFQASYSGGTALTYTGDWTQGDDLALLFFPGLNAGSQIQANQPYGYFRSDTIPTDLGVTGQIAFDSPQEGNSYALIYLNNEYLDIAAGSGHGINGGATKLNFTGNSYVIPEPHALALVGLGVVGLAISTLARRRRS